MQYLFLLLSLLPLTANAPLSGGPSASAPDTAGKPFVFTDANYAKTVGEHKGLVVIDFWAIWCGPCRAIAPIIEELAGTYPANKVLIGKLDVDKNPNTAAMHGIRAIPTIILIKKGQVVDRIVGLNSKEEIKRRIEAHK
ncbi:MAG: thioredoxin [Saprospiraceae bacterium]